MRILDLQRRLREIGRIRIGEQVPTGRGKTRPAKLETFRLTSRDRSVIDAAAETYGGQVLSWDAPDGQQWQVTTTAAEMPVTVPPGEMSFSQAYEQWSAGGCRVRCDGEWDHVGDRACHCDPTQRACAIHTRLSVILHELPGLGVWRLDTSGYYAAVELGGVVDLAAGAAAQGQMLPARLRLEQRSVKRIVGEKSETRRFAVPVLDLDVHPMSLTTGTPVAAPAIGSGPRFQPVPAELDSPPVAPVADQVPALSDGGPKRRNSAAPIPATGAKPRTAAQAADASDLAPPEVKRTARKAPAKKKPAAKKPAVDAAPTASLDAIQTRIDQLAQQDRQDLGAWWKAEGIPPLRSGDVTPDQAAQIHDAIDAYGPPEEDQAGARNRKMWALAAEAWDEPDRDTRRKALIGVVTDGRSESSKDLTDDEWTDFFDALELIGSGSTELAQRSNGEWELRPVTGGAA